MLEDDAEVKPVVPSANVYNQVQSLQYCSLRASPKQPLDHKIQKRLVKSFPIFRLYYHKKASTFVHKQRQLPEAA